MRTFFLAKAVVLFTVFQINSTVAQHLVQEANIMGPALEKEKFPEYVPNEIIIKYKFTNSLKSKAKGAQIIEEHRRVSDKISDAFNLKIKETKPVHSYLIKKMSEQNKGELELQEETFYKRQAKKAKQLMSKGMSLKSLKKFVPKENNFAQTLVLRLKDIDEDVLTIIDELNNNKALLANEGIEIVYVEPNRISYTSLIPNDLLYNQQWSHKMTNAEAAWDIETGDSSIVIAIIDTGVDIEHEDLKDNIHLSGGYDFVDIDTSALFNSGHIYNKEDYVHPDNDPTDRMGHGTSVAGIAAAKGGNYLGVTGVAPFCSIMPLRAGCGWWSDTPGYLTGGVMQSHVIDAIYFSVENGADIINMSFGLGSSQLYMDIFDFAYENGIILITAAGNENNDYDISSGAYENVLNVTSTNQYDLKARSSTYGYWTDIAAPGDRVLTTVLKNNNGNCDPSGYLSLSGTSLASPYIAGVAALILSKNPNWTPSQVIEILKQSVDNPREKDHYIGTGRVNVLKAMQVDSLIKNNCNAVAEITNLVDFELHTEDIIIEGLATGESYSLLYGRGRYPQSWEEFDSGLNHQSDTLGVLYLEHLADGIYTIKLKVTDSGGFVESISTIRIADFSIMQENWPVEINSANAKTIQNISVSDLNNNGSKELIVISGSHNEGSHSFSESIYIYEANGELLNNWPQTFPDNGYSIAKPVFADINKDGLKEIIVAGNFSKDCESPYLGNGLLMVFDINGQILNGWPQMMVDPDFESEICVGDINVDGEMEIFVAGYPAMCAVCSKRGYLYAYSSEGDCLPGWPIRVDTLTADTSLRISSNLITLNVDDDPEKEIVFSAWNNLDRKSYCFAVNYDGSMVEDFLFISGEWKRIDHLTVADIDNDDMYEILTDAGILSNGGQLLTLISIPPYQSTSISEISLGNLDSDPELEMIFSSSDPIIMDYHGNILHRFPQKYGNSVYKSILIADVLADTDQEVIVPYTDNSNYGKSGICIYDIEGNICEGFPKFEDIWELERLLVTDFDNDGDVELIGYIRGTNTIIALDFNKEYDPNNIEWPMQMHDELHSATYFKPNTLSLNTLNDVVVYKNDIYQTKAYVNNPNYYDLLFTAESNTDSIDLVIQNDTLSVFPKNNWIGTAKIDIAVNAGEHISSTSFHIQIKKLIEDISDITIFNRLDTTLLISTYSPNDSVVVIQAHCTNDSLNFDFDSSYSNVSITALNNWYGTDDICLIATCGDLIDSTSFQIIIPEPIHTGINDNLLSVDLKVYPNPSRGVFNLNFSSFKNEDLIVEVFDLQGRKIFNKEILSSQQFNEEITIDLRVNPKGIYMLKVLANNSNVGYSKIIIE